MVENKCYDPDCNEEECFNPEHYNYICFDPDCNDEKCMNEKHYDKQLLKDYQKSTYLSVFDHREEIDYDEDVDISLCGCPDCADDDHDHNHDHDHEHHHDHNHSHEHCPPIHLYDVGHQMVDPRSFSTLYFCSGHTRLFSGRDVGKDVLT